MIEELQSELELDKEKFRFSNFEGFRQLKMEFDKFYC